jgi:hypothetical protein
VTERARTITMILFRIRFPSVVTGRPLHLGRPTSFRSSSGFTSQLVSHLGLPEHRLALVIDVGGRPPHPGGTGGRSAASVRILLWGSTAGPLFVYVDSMPGDGSITFSDLTGKIDMQRHAPNRLEVGPDKSRCARFQPVRRCGTMYARRNSCSEGLPCALWQRSLVP